MRVAFTLIGNKEWTGGSHYLRNLLRALHELPDSSVESILFVGDDASQKEIDALSPYLTKIVRDGCFTKWAPSWGIRQVLRRTIDNDVIAKRLFNRYNIEVVFHSGLFGTRFPLPCVSWIADFQHLHLPEMFSPREIKFRDRLFCDLSRMSKRIVVSSECARKDFESFLPDYLDHVDVLRFVAQLPKDVYEGSPSDKLLRYNLPEKFFHLPNQFWKHKNHLLVVDALKLLKKRGNDVFVVCSGSSRDPRNPDYFDSLQKEILRNELDINIALVGMVPIDHLYAFMRQSVAVLNPSLFEGWSTTVEEAKSLGKRVLLSDIPVHNEQNPPGGIYFSPKDPNDLANKMLRVWEQTPAGPDYKMEEDARLQIEERVQLFAKEFINILRKAAS